MKILSAFACFAVLAAGTAASAAAPQPTKPVAASFYSGRWYEIARIANAGQRDCQAPSTQFTDSAAGVFQVVQSCRAGSPTGKIKTYNTKGRVVSGSNNAKFVLDFLGGMKKQEYWVLDAAADGSWAIMATPGGNYIWLLSRKANLPTATRDRIVARARALGYRQKLEFPAHPAG